MTPETAMSNRKNPPPVDIRRRQRDRNQSVTPEAELADLLKDQDSESRLPPLPSTEEVLNTAFTSLRSSVSAASDATHDAIEPVPALAPAAADDLKNGDAEQGHRAQNLILVVMRTPATIPDVSSCAIKHLLEIQPVEINGASRGFSVGTHPKCECQPYASEISMSFKERYGRAVGKLFERWGRRIGAAGIHAQTSVEFMLIEPDSSGTLVVDAWHCRNMYPAAMSTYSAQRTTESLCEDPVSVHVAWGGEVDFLYDHAVAQALLDELHVSSSNPYEPMEAKRDAV